MVTRDVTVCEESGSQHKASTICGIIRRRTTHELRHDTIPNITTYTWRLVYIHSLEPGAYSDAASYLVAAPGFKQPLDARRGVAPRHQQQASDPDCPSG